MVSDKRVKTLGMIVGSHSLLANDPHTADIVRELKRVTETNRITGSNRWLLQVLHTTRALDTYLSRVVDQCGWNATTPALGSYLVTLKSHGVIVEQQRYGWQQKIVKPRNTYMHSANQMPAQQLANEILNEMDACMSVILAKT
jgi:hypothetical protein